MSFEGALVGEVLATLQTLVTDKIVSSPQVSEQVGFPARHVVTFITADALGVIRRLNTDLQSLGIEDLPPIIRPRELFLNIKILQCLFTFTVVEVTNGVNITELVIDVGKSLFDVDIHFHL